MPTPHLIPLPSRAFPGWAIDRHLQTVTDSDGRRTMERTPLAESMYTYRYKGATELLPRIVSAFQDAVSALRAQPGFSPDFLLAAPPAVSRPEYRRVVELSAALSKSTGIPSVQHWVECTGRQTSPPRDGSPKQAPVFRLTSEKARASLERCRLLLVDDIYRSGRTIEELARLLKDEAGAGEVCVLVGTVLERE